MSHDMNISTIFDEGIPFEVDIQKFFEAYKRTGCPKPKSLFDPVPRWSTVAYAVAGERGLRWAKGASDAARDDFRAAMRSAVMLGGMDAARQAARSFVPEAQVDTYED